MRIARTRGLATAVAALAALTLVGAACGGDDDDSAATPAAATAPSSPMTAAPDAQSAVMLEPSGSACGAVPTDGEGSFEGMADDPAATAASNNPQLTTLVAAVQAAGLVDTLNGAGPFTIFAPVNGAFEKIPTADLDAVLANTDLLTSILTYHVVAGQMSSADLATAGMVTTVNGADVTVAKQGDQLVLNGGAATVVCQDVPTANATVYLIDSVLMPPA
jgi:transforming growth factor-beta-induced protein